MTDNNLSVAPLGSIQNMNPYVFDDIDMDFGMNPVGMGGSIFDGYMGMGMGMMPMYPGVGFDSREMFDRMKEYQKFYIDYNVDQQNMQRNADLRINASVEGIKGSATVLRDKILQNEQDQIPEAFEAYLKSVSLAYGEGTPAQIKSRALTLYQQMTGRSLIQDLRENSHGSFTQGLLQSLTFSTTYRHSAEDNISDITGQPVGTGEKAAQNTGRVVGAIGAGAAAGGITKLFTKGSAATTASSTSKLSKFVPKFLRTGAKAGKVGLIVGLAAGLLSFITGRVST